ncbi:hypothetical protein KI387_007410 [Taxus chinensis]|uniref:Pentatricopeptide repeat-containing protein n=1 Tax=Taxus chinensis TaxID=29808 RepID=A0AA38LN16_TAXCH|nr:hypothetical protein KI387_007410 [Taxus chinensis]
MLIHRIKSTSPLRFFKLFGTPLKSTRNPNFSGFLVQQLSTERRFCARSPVFSQSMPLTTFSSDKFEPKNKQSQSPSENLGENPTKNDDDNSAQDAQTIFKKMKETGLIPNAVAMLDGLCKDGLVQEAMKLFGEMRQKGSIPEVVIYTAVVEGFCRALKLDDAKRIFRKMQDNRIVPNAYSYGILIQGLCKDKKLDEALKFTLEMLDKGWKPNVASYVALIDGFCKEQRLDEAKRAIHTFKAHGFLADERAVRDYMGKKGPFFPAVREVLFGKKDRRDKI